MIFPAGEAKDNHRSLSKRALRLHRSTVENHDMLNDGETKSRATFFTASRFFNTVEPLKNVR